MDRVKSTAKSETRGAPPIELCVAYSRINALLADCLKHLSRPETFIATARPLPVGTEFHFVLETPEIGVSLILRGRVARTKRRKGRAQPDAEEGMGISFLSEDDDTPSDTSEQVIDVFREALGAHVAERLLLVGAPLAGKAR